MCFSKQRPTPEPAAAPAPPLPAPSAPGVGQSRRQETQDNNGGDTQPNYRVKRNVPTVTPSSPIQM